MKSLSDQTSIAGLHLKNRLVRSATRDGLADDRGHVTAALLERYIELARGGVGTIITGHAYVTEKEQSWRPGQMGIYNDSFIVDYQPLTAAVHAYDCRIILQLSCLGAQTFADVGGKLIWGPSPVADLATGIVPREMTRADIGFLQTAFAAAALRARAAGFDGVQIHAAHGYLHNKFLNPYYNRRTDEYGGCVDSRVRMLSETYAAMRNAVGDEYPLLVKVNCDDFQAGGMPFEECRQICRQLDAAGIDAIEISGGSLSSPHNFGPIRTNVSEHPSYFLRYAADIAERVAAPVLLVGGNRDFSSLTRVLNRTEIQLISLCRPLICQPDLVSRWLSGEDIKPMCTSCNQCLGLTKARCILNPED